MKPAYGEAAAKLKQEKVSDPIISKTSIMWFFLFLNGCEKLICNYWFPWYSIEFFSSNLKFSLRSLF